MNAILGRRTMRALVLVSTVTLTLLGGAGLARAHPAAPPSIAITSEVGTVDHPLVPDATGFTFTVAPSNFTFDPDTMNKANQSGIGHWHVYVDTIDPAHPFSPSYVTFGATTTIHVTLTELARHIRVDRSTLGEMINRMAERSLISKRNNDNDRRSAEVLLAPAGEKALLKVVAGAAELQTALLAPLAAEDRAHFMRCMKLVAEPEPPADDG